MLGTEKYVFGGLGSEKVNEEFLVMNEELLQDLHLSSYDPSIGSDGTMCLDELQDPVTVSVARVHNIFKNSTGDSTSSGLRFAFFKDCLCFHRLLGL